MSHAVETERQRFGGELTPEIIPLLSALEAKKLLIKGAGPANVFRVIHDEIKRSNGNRGTTRRDLFLFHGSAMQSQLAIQPATPVGAVVER